PARGFAAESHRRTLPAAPSIFIVRKAGVEGNSTGERASDFANQYPHGIELADDRGVWGREQPE
ncbi:MAG TPA: hypothetical protein VIH17_13855, partial [Candidatus Acidoferrales bacterium]